MKNYHCQMTRQQEKDQFTAVKDKTVRERNFLFKEEISFQYGSDEHNRLEQNKFGRGKRKMGKKKKRKRKQKR